MKIFIAEKLADAGLSILKEGDHTIINCFVNGDALKDALAKEQPQVLIVRSCKVTAAHMEAAPSIELIVRAGAGFDTIDVLTASKRGIFVANCPGKNASAVAELALGLILSLDRRIPENVADGKSGVWNKAKYSKAEGIKGKTLGVIGTGNIGMELIKRAQGMEMNVIAWSRSLTTEKAALLGVIKKDSPIDVALEADIISLHVASNTDTKSLCNKAFFEAMKKNALFVNTTRGDVVDEEALRWAMDTKGVRAGLDVYSGEPAGKDGSHSISLASHPSVYITHHIGASTEQAQDETAVEAVRVISVYEATGKVVNCVNMETKSHATHLLTVRHYDKVGVLAAVLAEIRKASWNVQEMENLVFQGSESCVARIRFHPDRPATSPHEGQVTKAIEALDNIIAVNVMVQWNREEHSSSREAKRQKLGV